MTYQEADQMNATFMFVAGDSGVLPSADTHTREQIFNACGECVAWYTDDDGNHVEVKIK